MQIQAPSSHSVILSFSQRSQSIKQNQDTYFNKHWQVIQTSIKFFVLQRASINIVAFRKSLELLVFHRHSQKIKEALVWLWKDIWGEILKSIQENESNPLITLIQNYKTIEDRLKIVFTFLKSYLDSTKTQKTDYIDQFGKHIIHQRPNSQKQAYNVLCKLILQSSYRQQYEKEMILLIDTFRNSTYKQNIISEETCKDEVRIDLLILKKIGLFRHLEQEFDQSSKEFYVQLSQDIPKNQTFLDSVNGYLLREIDLNRIFELKINTVYYVEKQLIRQYFDYVLENLLEDIIAKKDKKSLKILWNFTLRLKDDALNSLSEKLKQIIHGVKKYFVKTTQKEDVFKLIEFRENLFLLTEECFQKNRKIFNLIYHTFEQVLYEEEKHYLTISLQNILQEQLTFDQERIKTEDEEQNSLSSKGFEQSSYFKLFRVAPSKENFIKQYQLRFCRWITNNGFEIKSLKMQQKMIQQMKKQVGNNLMKPLDRMLNDVYRNGQMHYYEQTISGKTLMKCMFLSSNWPVQVSIVFNIPDELYNMQNDFEAEFKRSIENKEKSVRWVSEMGTLRITIHGVESLFSEVQAAVIMVLDKSIRPLKRQQIEASLNVCNMNQSVTNFSSEAYVLSILSNLAKHNILTFNQGPETYDINDENLTSYKFERVKEEAAETQKVKKGDAERDNSILIEAAIVKILKKRKNMQRSDITRFIEETIKRFRPTFEQVTKAFQKLQNSNYIEINREKGIISYLE